MPSLFSESRGGSSIIMGERGGVGSVWAEDHTSNWRYFSGCHRINAGILTLKPAANSSSFGDIFSTKAVLTIPMLRLLLSKAQGRKALLKTIETLSCWYSLDSFLRAPGARVSVFFSCSFCIILCWPKWPPVSGFRKYLEKYWLNSLYQLYQLL